MAWNSLYCLWDIQRVPVLSVTINNANESSSMPRQFQSKNSVQISVVQTHLKNSNLKILQVWNMLNKTKYCSFFSAAPIEKQTDDVLQAYSTQSSSTGLSSYIQINSPYTLWLLLLFVLCSEWSTTCPCIVNNKFNSNKKKIVRTLSHFT